MNENMEELENQYLNIMSTNRTLNSQLLSKSNFNFNLRNSLNTLNNNNLNINISNSQTINSKNFNTINTVKELNPLFNNTFDRLGNRDDNCWNNYHGINFNTIKYAEDYTKGFEIITKVLGKLFKKLSQEESYKIHSNFNKLINKLKIKISSFPRNSCSLSNKSSKSAKSTKSILSERYEKYNPDFVNFEKSGIDSYISNINEQHDNYWASKNSEKADIFQNNNLILKNNDLKIVSNRINQEIKNSNLNIVNNSSSTHLNRKYLKLNSNIDFLNIKEKNSEEENYISNNEDIENNSFDSQTHRENLNKDTVNTSQHDRPNPSKIINNTECRTEILNISKIIIKNISLFYKRNKNNYLKEFLNKLNLTGRWNKINSVLNKNIMMKHYYTLDFYFSKLKKINNYYKGIINVRKIFNKYLLYVFDIFGNKTRVIQIRNKYLEELMNILDRVKIRKQKYLLLKRLLNLNLFKLKLPLYELFISKLFKTLKRNITKKGLMLLRKYYFTLKIYTRNLLYFVDSVNSLILKEKKMFMLRLRNIYLIQVYLKNLIIKKHLKRMFFLKISFKKFIENSLDSHDGLYMRIKLKKVFKIYSYMLKLQSVKVN